MNNSASGHKKKKKKKKGELRLILIGQEEEAGTIAVELQLCESIVALLSPLSPVFFAFIPQHVITSRSLSFEVAPAVIGMRGVNTLSIGLI